MWFCLVDRMAKIFTDDQCKNGQKNIEIIINGIQSSFIT